MIRFKEVILREPYRLFFPLAVVCGMIGAGHWFLYGTGIIPHYSGFLHASIQMQVFMGAFVAGFLMTALPRMSATFPATPFELSAQILLTVAVAAAYLVNRPSWGQGLYLLWLFFLGRFLFRRFRARDVSRAPLAHPPVEFIWVPAGILCAAAGAVSLLAAHRFKHLGFFGQQIVNQGFILAVVAGVGSFLGPRLTGRFRTQKAEAVCSPGQMSGGRGRVLLQLAGIVLFIASFVLEGMHHGRMAYALRASVMTFYFFLSGILPKWPKVRDFYAWLLWLSFWFVALGLWGCAAHMQYRKASLHVSFVAGLGLMTYSVATMVVLSHAGRSPELRKPLPVLQILLAGVLISLGFRLASVFFAEQYFKLLTVSSAVWMLTGVIWLVFTWRYLRLVPDGDASRESHEQMKKRVLKS